MNNETYQVMSSQVDKDYSQEELIELYKNGETSLAVAGFYVNNYGYIKKITKKYFSFEQQELDSYVLLAINNTYQDYDESKKSSFISLFRRYFNTTIVDEIRKTQATKREMDYNHTSIEAEKEYMEGSFDVSSANTFYDNDTIRIDLDELENLSDNERYILELIIDSKGNIDQKYIADKVGISQPAVSKALNRIKDKYYYELKELISSPVLNKSIY